MDNELYAGGQLAEVRLGVAGFRLFKLYKQILIGLSVGKLRGIGVER